MKELENFYKNFDKYLRYVLLSLLINGLSLPVAYAGMMDYVDDLWLPKEEYSKVYFCEMTTHKYFWTLSGTVDELKLDRFKAKIEPNKTLTLKTKSGFFEHESYDLTEHSIFGFMYAQHIARDRVIVFSPDDGTFVYSSTHRQGRDARLITARCEIF